MFYGHHRTGLNLVSENLLGRRRDRENIEAIVNRKIPEERLWELKKIIDRFPKRSPERRAAVEHYAQTYNVSPKSVYRGLLQRAKPRPIRRSDTGSPRVLDKKAMVTYCQLIAAMKLRTLNKKGHHLSTVEAIRLLEEFGLETAGGLIKAPVGVLKRSTVNRYLKLWRLDLKSLQVEPVSVRFQAEHSNDCWQFDLSPSDMKDLAVWPEWVSKEKGRPVLMLYSITDDRSGVVYQEYHVTFGEDVEAALRFLYRAMAPKQIEDFPFEGIPAMIYMDSGPIRRSGVFQRAMTYMGIEIRSHMPKGSDGRRTTSRAKGKGERPFRTVKELHETLYHFHKPKDIEEANQWLLNFVLRYNDRPHRSESHSRIQDWVRHLPTKGLRKVCTWERFATFAREPEKRKVKSDATVEVEGVSYQINPELAGERVVLWWGLFDQELYVEFGEERFGPFFPTGGPIPLHRFKKFKKSTVEKQADAIEVLAKEISLPKEALTKSSRGVEALVYPEEPIKEIEFEDPDPFQEFTYPNVIQAKKAIACYLGIPLVRLSQQQRDQIDQILGRTMRKDLLMKEIRGLFQKGESDVK